MAHFGKPTCPICGLRCVSNIDAIQCPDHGLMTGLELAQMGSAKGVDALIEVRANQLHRLVYDWFGEARRRAANGTLSEPLYLWVF